MSKEWRLGSENNHITFPGLVVSVLLFFLFVFVLLYGDGALLEMNGENVHESVIAGENQ